MNINWAAPTIDILIVDYPPIINILDYPPNHFSLDSSHALTPIILDVPVYMECMYTNSNTV